MERKNLVPSLELCKQLDAPNFSLTHFMWCEDDKGAAVIERDSSCPDGGTHRIGYPGQLVYPAPTIGELMRAIMWQVGKLKTVELKVINDGKPHWFVRCHVTDSLHAYLEDVRGPQRPEDQLAQTYLMLREAKKRRRAATRKEKQNG